MRLVLVCLAVLALSGTAAAAVGPDAHDRALVKQLGDKIAALKSVVSKQSDTNNLLDNCPAFKKNPSQAFAAAFVLLPAVLVDAVNRYKPQLQDVRSTLAGMHADSPLFRQWLTAEAQSIDLILQFDNHGKTIDYCKAAQVMLSKKSTPTDIKNVLGIDPALIAKLFQGAAQGPGTLLTKLKPQMRAFFVAGGLTPKQAQELTA
jgi:hypothetical protein